MERIEQVIKRADNYIRESTQVIEEAKDISANFKKLMPRLLEIEKKLR